MTYLKRIIYILYYLKNLNFIKLKSYISYCSTITNQNLFNILVLVFYNSIKYNISILEYFQFRFFEINEQAKRTYAGTGFMYEYQLRMNPKSKREILNDKRKFYKNYTQYFIHCVYGLEELNNDTSIIVKLLCNISGKLVFKNSTGKCGSQVEIVETKNINYKDLLSFMGENNYNIVEEFVVQHKELNKLSPSGVNTIRIFTQLDKNNNVDILGCRLRITVNSTVDNLAAGNMAAPIDEKTGVVCGNGVYSDITKKDEEFHPVTNVKIEGFQVPFWKETLELAKNAALLHKENRSIGWDIVITDKGPGLIEGNHDWCKLLWQLPVKKGLKPMLEKYNE